MKEFYYGASWKWPLEYLPRVMLSMNSIRTLKHPWIINKPLMIDSGAYSAISLYGKYPYSTDDYTSVLEKWNPNVAWTMDYPCEKNVREKGNYNCKEAQLKTIENTLKIIEKYPDISMVVQGYEVNDYLENLDIIKEQGLLTERLGIGTLCRRNQNEQIVKIIKAVHKNVPNWVKLHGFGVKLSVLKTNARFLLYSADSSAWFYSAFRKSLKEGKKISGKRTLPYLLYFIDTIEKIIDFEQKTETLETFIPLMEVEK